MTDDGNTIESQQIQIALGTTTGNSAYNGAISQNYAYNTPEVVNSRTNDGFTATLHIPCNDPHQEEYLGIPAPSYSGVITRQSDEVLTTGPQRRSPQTLPSSLRNTSLHPYGATEKGSRRGNVYRAIVVLAIVICVTVMVVQSYMVRTFTITCLYCWLVVISTKQSLK